MKKYIILVAVLTFWLMITAFMMSDCHQNYCPQPNCYAFWSSWFFIAMFGLCFVLAYDKVIHMPKQHVNKRILKALLIYLGLLLIYFGYQINAPYNEFYQFVISKKFSLGFSCLSLVLILIQFRNVRY